MKNQANQKEQQHQEVQENETSLFRQEVIQAQKGSYFGKTLIVTPVSFSIWSFGIFFTAVSIGLFLYFGSFTKRQTVSGILVPDKGVISIYARNQGVIVKRFVEQGEEVKNGQLLYLISTEQAALVEQGSIAKQVALLEKQIVAQKNRIAMFEKNAAGYTDLLKRHYITEPAYQERRDNYLSAKLQLFQYKKELSQAKDGVEYAIRSPKDGTTSMLIAVVGDHVTGDTQLGSIVPAGSQLIGQLFIPTSKAGFVKVGQKVLLKYSAYPYQSFGLYEATVSKIDKSILNPNDAKDLRAFSLPVRMDEVFYRVTVTLKKQTVTVYGKEHPLPVGMLLEGVVLGEKRYIWQWILEPLYSLRGVI
jgi:membrane fusion protein